MFSTGRGCERSQTKAFSFLNEAANQGYPPALDRLAMCYRHGFGVAIDKKKAVRFYERAASAGFVKSRYQLAQMYSHGEGTVTNLALATKYLYQAAGANDGLSQMQLGLAYWQGNYALNKDERKAEMWLWSSVSNGWKYAYYHLGELYFQGKEFVDCRSKALESWKEGASRGVPGCAGKMGDLYERGIQRDGMVLGKDLRRAAEWYKKACGMTKFNKKWQSDFERIKRKIRQGGIKPWPNADIYYNDCELALFEDGCGQVWDVSCNQRKEFLSAHWNLFFESGVKECVAFSADSPNDYQSWYCIPEEKCQEFEKDNPNLSRWLRVCDGGTVHWKKLSR